MACKGALLLLFCSLTLGQASPRPRRLRALAANVSAEKPRVTWNNCSCVKDWDEQGLGSCKDYCCNPNGDVSDWCVVKDEECEGSEWGYCKPAQPIRPGCHDSPRGWTDVDEAPCSDYYVYQWCNTTGGIGDGWGDDWGPLSAYASKGHSATEACCACGGGSLAAGEAPVTICSDLPGWYDSDGDECDDYAEMHWCNSTGGYGLGWHAEDWGTFPSAPGKPTAPFACCVCGGGVRAAATAAPGPSSTPPPSATAAPLPATTAAPTTAAPTTAAPATTSATPAATPAPPAPAPPTTSAPAAAATTLAAGTSSKRFTWNGCLCRREWEGDMLSGSLNRGQCRSSCCSLGDAQGEWCIVEDSSCEDQQWGYCRPPSQGAESCTNSPVTWQDSQSNNCDAYQYMGWCTAQGGYGAKWREVWGTFADYAGTDGRTAAQACCRCGGGQGGVAQTSNTALQCVDKAGWHDNDGDTCSRYAENFWCTSTGGYGQGWHSEWGTFEFYSGQFTAAAACCACGGGSLTGQQQLLGAQGGSSTTPPPAPTGISSKTTLVGLALAVLLGAGVGIYCFRAKAAGAKTGGRTLALGSTQLGRKYQSADGL